MRFFKRALSKQDIRTYTLTGLTLLTPVMVYAAGELVTFYPGKKILSDEVNQNFAQLDGRVKTYENAIAVDSLSSVGIGTTTPGAKLDIAGPGSAAIVTRADGSRYSAIGDTGGTDDGGVFLYNSSGTLQSVIRAQGDSYIHGGNVGIGTSSPTSPLHVMGNGLPTLTLETATTASGSSAGIELITKQQEVWTLAANGSDNSFGIRSGLDANDTLFYLSADGNVGIGTTSPRSLLHVQDSAISVTSTGDTGTGAGELSYFAGIGARHLNIYNNYSGDSARINFQMAFGTSVNDVMSLTRQGNVGIGTTTPAYSLDVNGEIRAVKVTQTSDARLKRDIRPLTHALEGIQCLQGVSYYLREPASDQGLQLGLIAQDVERCYPELVSTDPEGYKGVSYDRLVAPLIEAVKEQQETITTLQAKNLSQQAQLASLEARLARLEKLVATGR